MLFEFNRYEMHVHIIYVHHSVCLYVHKEGCNMIYRLRNLDYAYTRRLQDVCIIL